MRANWMCWQKRLAVMAAGGVTFGILQGFSLVSFASLFTNLLASWLSIIVALLLGADPDTVFRGN